MFEKKASFDFSIFFNGALGNFFLSLLSPGEAGEPHQEAGQPLGGRDGCQSWLQGEKHQHLHHHHHL